ncbi:hypothetical protein H0H81_002484 [Sphagnurus paluster]|uniref:Protein kinase domain-containing protein n=1 Tax=Sphagnurus paluster TaxID=117069 RepID=A0A9P7FVJ6_9AGAR|nr:hypothetical protein H0H81_002484 [Sphagnurus paluster]
MIQNGVSLPNYVKAPFDPADVVTTDHLAAYLDAGRPMLNNYTRHAKIGEGQHGEVYLCYQVNKYPPGHPDRRVPVAMKSVKRDNARDKRLRQLRQQRLPNHPHTPIVDRLGTTEAKIRKEIAIMKKCRHPHVVRLYEIIDDRTRDKIYMVMEYLAGGEVKWKNEHEEPILSVIQTRRIIRDAVLGLEYLHHQGIIHRDIKPANLLWTEDRRQVKIADFGVSHFSYAQRLAAAGKDGGSEDPEDPILLDDSDLTRRAGTPSFLAPEIVYEHTEDTSPGSSSLGDIPTAASSSIAHATSSQSVPGTQRPPITQSIDVWALGVTLYCLLFGKVPFLDTAAHGSEWSLYNVICNRDWTVEETMGSDRIPTGGRHPKADDTEGAQVVRLLDQFLKKDAKARVTLDQVKRNKWILRDIPEPDMWLQLTMPRGRIDVSVDETSVAMSSVRFTWNWNVVSRRISSLFRRSRDHQQRSDDRDARGPVKSDPHVHLHGYESTRLQDTYTAPTSKRDKGKRRAGTVTTVRSSKSLRSKSTERWPVVASASRSTSAIVDPNTTPRRGSITLLTSGASVATSSRYHTISSARPGSSPTDTKPRARFANIFNFNSMTHWRPNKYSNSAGASPTDPSGPSSHRAAAAPPSRRSEEALRKYRGGGAADMSLPNGPLTADRRASSWGQGDQAPIELAEAASLISSYDFHERTAAGVYNAGEKPFAPRTPSRLSTNVATSGEPSCENGDVGRDAEVEQQDAGEEDRKFGPPCFDEDSSTIASADGGWRGGSDDDEDDGEDGVDDICNGLIAFDDDGDENDDGGESSDDDDDDQGENAVTFSPRRRPPPIE